MTRLNVFLQSLTSFSFWFSWWEPCSSLQTPSAGNLHSFLGFHRSILKRDPNIKSLNNPVTRWSAVVFIDTNQADSCLTCIFVCVFGSSFRPVGFICFSGDNCGPLLDKQNNNMFSRTPQLFRLLLINLGNQIQQVAFTAIVVVLLFKNLVTLTSVAAAAQRFICDGLFSFQAQPDEEKLRNTLKFLFISST